MIPSGYRIEKTNQQVQFEDPALLTRFKWRAERRCKKLNKQRRVPFYRFEVIRWWKNDRWAVVAMQNRLVPVD